MKLGIGAKLGIYFGLSTLATIGVVGIVSHLLRDTSTSWRVLNDSTKQNTQASVGLIESFAKLQGVTLRIIREEDPDVLESLVDEYSSSVSALRDMIADEGAEAADIAESLEALDAANSKATESVLLGRGAQASQIFIEQSNPVFEGLLHEIASLQDDRLVSLEASAAAERAGALGSGISGSGPSLFALCRSKESAGRVAASMQAAFQDLGHEAETLVSPAECPGARIL